MTLLVFSIPVGLLAIAYAHESFALVMASACTLFVAAAVNFASLRNLFLVLSSLAFTWTVAEALLSALEDGKGGAISFYERGSGKPVQVWRLHEQYGMLPRPGEYNAIKHDGAGQVIYDATYTIGDDGFRHTPQAQERHGERVYFLGDSATFGEGLDDDETLPFHWAALNPEAEVTNLAMSAWGLHQAYAVWQDQILDEGALVFVQTAPWHADRSACIPEFSTFSPRFELRDGELVQNGRCRVIVGNVLLDRALKSSRIVARLYDAFYSRYRAQKFALYMAIIDEMRDLARIRGQCLIVAFNKALESYFEDTDYDNQKIARHLKEKQIEVVDVTLADQKENLDPAYYIAGDGHPSNEANRLKARLLSTAKVRCATGADAISGRSLMRRVTDAQDATASGAATPPWDPRSTELGDRGNAGTTSSLLDHPTRRDDATAWQGAGTAGLLEHPDRGSR